jgi:hypothetical protein
LKAQGWGLRQGIRREGEDPELRRWVAGLGDAGEGQERRAAARARLRLGKRKGRVCSTWALFVLWTWDGWRVDVSDRFEMGDPQAAIDSLEMNRRGLFGTWDFGNRNQFDSS